MKYSNYGHTIKQQKLLAQQSHQKAEKVMVMPA
jgi:hypothetical protein